MSNVTIVSPFRDNGNLTRYIDQVIGLDFSDDQMRFIAIEGDSVDDTLKQLQDWQRHDKRVTIIEHITGRPKYPSLISKERFAHLSGIFNAGLDVVDCDWSTHTLFLPSDVIFNRDLLQSLLDKNKDSIAPMFWHNTNAHFNGCVRSIRTY